MMRRHEASLRAASRELILDCGEGVRLQAFSAAPTKKSANHVVVLLHGWEGSAGTFYVQSLGQLLLEAGADVVRLNLRDHGATHHLNRDIFHSCRLSEVIGAVAAIAALHAGKQLSLVGFSLGGNFMLRVAASGDDRLGALWRVVAVSPVLDPANTLTALEQCAWPYHRYFVHKWTRSLRLKQSAWAGDYDFDALGAEANLRHMTDVLVRRYTDYPNLSDYLSGYAITGERLQTLTAPAVILTAKDDPIIPVADLERLARHPQLKIVVTERGGHMGYMSHPLAPSWINGFVCAELGL
jgi:uncharacterized protein